MPAGAGASGSACGPSCQGKREASAASALSAISHIPRSREKKSGKNGMERRSLADLASSLGGSALPCFCTSHRWNPSSGTNSSQNHYVQCEDPLDRSGLNHPPAAHEVI